MKLLTLTILSAFFLIGTASVSMAHCGMCGEDDNHAEISKPCEKCAMAGKTCGCAGKAKHDHKMKKMDADEPCRICDQSEREWQTKQHNMKVKNIDSEKGSLRIIKTKPLDDRYND